MKLCNKDDTVKEIEDTISDDELWRRAGTGEPITRKDLGIAESDRNDGLETIMWS